MEYNISGGVNTVTGDVDWLEVHSGVIYVKGKVGTLVHHGGVMYDQRPSNRVEYRTDHISDEERSRYRRQIAELENRLSRSESECLKLRKKLDKSGERLPDDDVLVAKIEHLQIELDNERKGRKQEVDDLKFRLKTALQELNDCHRNYNDAIRYEQQLNINDEILDVFATLVNLYPFTTDGDLAFEFGIDIKQVKEIAKILRLAKSSEKRKEAVDYLRRQHIEFVQRRGGNQGNFPMSKPVEKISRNGRVIKTYSTISEAEEDTKHAAETIRNMCKAYDTKRKYTKEGYTFRYRDNEQREKDKEKENQRGGRT